MKNSKDISWEKNHTKWTICQIENQVVLERQIVTLSTWPIQHQWMKTSKNVTFWFIPTKETKETVSLSLYRKDWNIILLNDINTQIAYTERKPNSCYNINDQTKLEHQHAFLYLGSCLDPNCNDNYIGAPVRRMSERIFDHIGRDSKLHLNKTC